MICKHKNYNRKIKCHFIVRLFQVQDVMGKIHGHANAFLLSELSRIRGLSTRLTGRTETLLIEKG
jgi:hypothetical protein